MSGENHLVNTIFLGNSQPEGYESYMEAVSSNATYSYASDNDEFMTELCIALVDCDLVAVVGGLDEAEFASPQIVGEVFDLLGLSGDVEAMIRWFGISGEKRGAIIETDGKTVCIISSDPVKAQVMYDLHIAPKLLTPIASGDSANTSTPYIQDSIGSQVHTNEGQAVKDTANRQTMAESFSALKTKVIKDRTAKETKKQMRDTRKRQRSPAANKSPTPQQAATAQQRAVQQMAAQNMQMRQTISMQQAMMMQQEMAIRQAQQQVPVTQVIPASQIVPEQKPESVVTQPVTAAPPGKARGKPAKKVKKKNEMSIFTRIAGIASILVCIACSVYLITYIMEGDTDKGINEELAALYYGSSDAGTAYASPADRVSIEVPEPDYIPEETDINTEDIQESDTDEQGAEPTENASATAKPAPTAKPQVSYGNINPKFNKLYDLNKDIVGWIRIPSTKIDYPVVKTTNNDYYLKNNYYKQSSKYGTLFLDYRNTITPALSKNTSVFGHNTSNGTMFTDLHKYKSIDFYKANPSFSFNTLYEDIDWVIWAVFITNADPAEDNGGFFEWRMTEFSDTIAYKQFVEECKTRSLYLTPVEVSPGEDMLTLTTCADEFTNARLVIMAKRLRPGEVINISNTIHNPQPLYPQAWYDRYGGAKPR